MENIKLFVSIGFVIISLAMLWYLFIYDSTQARTRNFEDPTGTYAEAGEQDNTGYPDHTAYPSGPSDAVREESIYDDDYEEPTYQEESYTQEKVASADERFTDYHPSDRTYGEMRYIEKRYSRQGQVGTYKGPVVNGQPNGFAIFEYDNGDMYIGEYSDGKRNGYGNSVFKKGKRVQLREYKNGKRVFAENVKGVSYGSLKFNKGTYYGPIKKNKPHGFGYFKYKNSDLYIGAYRNGKRDGGGNSVFAQSGNIEPQTVSQ